MRDLANQNFPSSKKSSPSKFLRLIILIVIVFGAFYFVKSKINFSGNGGSAVVLQDLPRNLLPIPLDNTMSVTDKGVDLVTQSALLKDVKYDGEYTGSAKRSYGGGTYILSVDATLPDPKGNSYGVWLVGDDDIILVDYMGGSKTSWSLRLRDTDKYSKYSGIWVTLERTRDNKSEEHVLEGSF